MNATGPCRTYEMKYAFTSSLRGIVARMMLIVYLMIMFSPLASLAVNAKQLAHALTGECTGSCDTCGCSAERSASHSCCCWRNKPVQHAITVEQEDDCCSSARDAVKVTIIRSCPCCNGKQPAFTGTEVSLVVPNRYSAEIPIIVEDALHRDSPERLTGRSDEPPVPPPRLIFLS